MSYALKRRHSIAREVARITDKQLGLAIVGLRGVGDPRRDRAIHEARRHVKKIRALLRLVKPSLGDRYYAANRRLRLTNRLLAPIADGEGVVDSLVRLRKRHTAVLGERAYDSLHGALVERAARTDRKAHLDRIGPKVARILRAEQQRLDLWALNARGFRAIEPGLEHSYRRARSAMRRAAAEPSANRYHRWRRRVKDLWLQMRLLEPRCGNLLSGEQRQLEALDDCLGEYHNVVLLEEALRTEALVSRRQTARALRALRRYQSELREQALELGRRALATKPRRFVRRVKGLWRSSKIVERARGDAAPWPRAA